MDQADVELRETILKVWSLTGKNKIDLLVPCTPSTGRGRLTVGKIYGGLLILDNWKQTKFGHTIRQPLKKVRGQVTCGLFLTLGVFTSYGGRLRFLKLIILYSFNLLNPFK